jgi:tetratricopeptide (TPR) repeat protein
MNSHNPFTPDDERNETVKRYESYLTGESTGYFDVDELETIVDFYLRKGRTKDCAQAIEFGLQLHPKNTVLLTKRAKVYLAAGDAKKAIRILDSLNSQDDTEMSMLRIEALIVLGRDNEARILADYVISQENSDTDLICLDIAYFYIGQLQFENALVFLLRGVEFNAKNTDLLFELAFCYEQLAKFDEAIQTYQRIIDINAFSSEAWFNLGQIYFGRNDYVNALEAYDYACSINPDDMLALLQKGHTLFQMGLYNLALDCYHDYDVDAILDSQSKIFVAECYEKLEDFETALVYYKQAVEYDPESFDGLCGAAVCLLELERYVESIEFAERALRIDENASDAWVYLAEGLIGIDDSENALFAYIKSVSIDPEQPDTLMSIANICMEKGQFEIALEYYSEALKQDPELEYVHLFMAVAYYKTGAFLQSKEMLHEASSRSPEAENLFNELCPEASKNILFKL